MRVSTFFVFFFQAEDGFLFFCFFFFKQKTAYEIMPSLVGSEMCIRDRPGNADTDALWATQRNLTPLTIPRVYSTGQLPAYGADNALSLIHISEPTRLGMISYAVFCLKKKKL